MTVPMQSYEVEVKALLGTPERAQEVRDALHAADPDCEITSRNRQLNHYFEPSADSTRSPQAAPGSGGGLPAQAGTLETLAATMVPHISETAHKKLLDFASRASSYSVRTRDKDNIVLLVVKASIGGDSSENGVSRMEFEEQVPLTINELDDLILASGFSYQAKWSREREEYACRGLTVSIDKNAGYGYLAEFEKVVDDASKADEARREIHAFMKSVGVTELPQDRIERMFSFYNAHWPEYYGTDRIFVVE